MSKKELTEEEKAIREENKKRSLANLKPLKPYSELTLEEQEKQRAICKKGFEVMQEKRLQKKSMNELAKSLLNQSVSKDKARTLIGDAVDLIPEDEITLSQVLNVCMVRETVDRGNVKAYEAIRDTAGFSPKQQIEISADIMTDSDRLLIDKISSRIG